MKIEKNHASILFLIGLMIVVLLRTMKCYSLDKRVETMQQNSDIKQNIYENFKVETFANEIVNERFNRFNDNLHYKLCDNSKNLNEKKQNIKNIEQHFKRLKPSNPNEGNPEHTDYITKNKYIEGLDLLSKFEHLLSNENARNEECKIWKHKKIIEEENTEPFIADYNVPGAKAPIKKDTVRITGEIVEDTLNKLDNKKTLSDTDIAKIGNNNKPIQANETFRQRNPMLRNNTSRVNRRNKNSLTNSSTGDIKTNILCPGININERRVTIDNLMPEFYYLKDHVKDLIMANQSYEKAFVK